MEVEFVAVVRCPRESSEALAGDGYYRGTVCETEFDFLQGVKALGPLLIRGCGSLLFRGKW